MDETKTLVEAERVAKATGSDVLIYNGEIRGGSARNFLDVVISRKRAAKLTLLVITPGGDPDEAFKIGRVCQNLYEHVTIFVSGWCKSAGTLVAIAAHDLVIGDRGELGPLDIQLAKDDELMEMASGLTVDAAMRTLESTAAKMFLNMMVAIRRDTGGMITTKTAADLAARMVTGLLEPVYRQIDPIKIGENSRAMNITKSYGNRLNLKSKNLRSPQSLEFLVSIYPDHRFVIDRTEAKSLFNRVSEPNQALASLADALGDEALMPVSRLSRDGSPYIKYLSSENAHAPAKETSKSKPRASKPAAKPLRLAKPRANGRTSPLNGG